MYTRELEAKMEYQRRKRIRQLRMRILLVFLGLSGLLLLYLLHNIGSIPSGNSQGWIESEFTEDTPEDTSYEEESSSGETQVQESENAGFETEYYPKSLLELAERNPEAKQFVMDYPKREMEFQPIDISKDVKKGEIPLFLQWDKRWGYEKYGDDFMAITGCGPCCLAMVYCGLTGQTDWNPYSIALEAEAEGYYVSGAGSSWDMMLGMAESLGLKAKEVIYDKEHIQEALEEGKPVICIMGQGDFTTSGHFIVLTGIDSEGNVTVCDPNSPKRSQKSWELEQVIPQIRNLWCYWK